VDHFTLIMILTALFTLAVIILAVVYAVRRQNRREKEAFAGLDGGRSSGRGELNGVEYRYKFTPGGKNTPPSFSIEVAAGSSGSFKIGRESGFDRFFKKIGLCAEIQTGDRDFDASYYISTNSVLFSRQFFSDPSKRAACRAITAAGFNEIAHDGKRFSAVRRPFKSGSIIDNDQIHAVVFQLTVLSRHLPELPSSRNPLAGQNWKARRFVAFAAPALVNAAGLTALVLGLSRYRPLDPLAAALSSWSWTVPASLITLLVCTWLIKGRSTSHREWIVVLALVLSGYTAGGAGLHIFFNGFLDPSAGVEHETRIVDKRITTTKNSKTFHAVVDSWRPEKRTEDIRINSWEFDRIQPEWTKMRVVTRSGRFSFEWIEDYELLQ